MTKNGMMKESLKTVVLGMAILTMVLMLSQDPAQAKVIRGEVVAVKDDGSFLSVKRPDPSDPSVKEQYDIMMLPDTKFDKIGSLRELAAGDEIAVDMTQNKESKIWEANSVRIFKLRLYQTDAAQELSPD